MMTQTLYQLHMLFSQGKLYEFLGYSGETYTASLVGETYVILHKDTGVVIGDPHETIEGAVVSILSMVGFCREGAQYGGTL